jgi:hypothetical protein
MRSSPLRDGSLFQSPAACVPDVGRPHPWWQIRIPLLWPRFVPSRYGARFAYGHIVEGDRHMIVSGGLGTSSVPVRLGMPPELVHIEIGFERNVRTEA